MRGLVGAAGGVFLFNWVSRFIFTASLSTRSGWRRALAAAETAAAGGLGRPRRGVCVYGKKDEKTSDESVRGTLRAGPFRAGPLREFPTAPPTPAHAHPRWRAYGARGAACPRVSRGHTKRPPPESSCRVQRGGCGSAARQPSPSLDSARVRRGGGVATQAETHPTGPPATKNTTTRDGGGSSTDGPPQVAAPRRRTRQSQRCRRRRQGRSHARFHRCRQQWLVSRGRGDG